MANVDHIKVGSTSYDISPSPTGTLTTGTGGFSSSDVAQGSATSWTNVDQITTSDKHASIFTKITQMAKNVRYLYNVLGTGFSTGSTVKSQIDSKAPSSHSHSVGQLPTSSTQVNSNDYIPTSALIYSMNQTLTSLNDASIKHKDVKTDTYGQYSTTDNISILNVISLTILEGLWSVPLHIFYSIFYNNKSNTTIVSCYYYFSYINNENLNEYLDNNRSDEIKISATQASINGSIDIRLYYINNK